MSTATEGPTAGFLVWRLATRWRVAVDRAVAPLGLTHAQYAVLASLYGLGAAGARPSQRELADRTGLEPLYVSKLARALDTAGLLHRDGDPADTRVVRLALTPAGRDVTGRAIALVRSLQDQLLAPLGGPGSDRSTALVAALTALLDTTLTLDAPEEES